MKNILDEKPNIILTGRLKRTMQFVSVEDLKNKNVLDVGCGYGWFVYNALKKGSSKVAGIEISENDLATVKKYLKNKKFTSKIGSAIDIPFKDNTFHTVVAWEVIEHIPKKTERIMFREASRVLKKNGILYISTPYHTLLSTFLDPAYWLVGHRHYTERKLRELAGEDFKVVKIEKIGGYWTILSILNMYFAKWIFKRERFFKSFFLKRTNKEYTSRKEGIQNIIIKYQKVKN